MHRPFHLLPVRRRFAQAMLAEILSQTLAAGMNVVEAFEAASQFTPGWRTRRLLVTASRHSNAGYPLTTCIAMAGLRLDPDLASAMDVGEERGRLADELAAAARRLDPQVDRRLAAALGRRPSATHFAAALARLLAHHHMTLSLVRDAARLIGPHDARFARALPHILEDIEGGSSLADSLARHSRIFDALYVRCIERAHTRESLRRVLERLAGGSISPAVLA